MNHTCHAHGCTVRISPRLLACRAHWFALRPALQRAIWKEYKFGQEVRKDPSPRYMAVQRLAVAELAFKPNDEEAARIAYPYLVEAQKWREAAIELDLGDPLEGLLPVAEAA